ncbi:54S ribosomal protein L25, mitochondrial [Neophaeococcomyces mojaviensis]|uniref:54S ribosomal protein L25, mitochondrial n=1 Tax=Neophaeococcomyces mojaviensis TaxID=3383035 RepID=A0ACC3A4P8_9EURO|nr:54S ribosomal protein L25, mitochondrial [Knufia sp. JES_112]
MASVLAAATKSSSLELALPRRLVDFFARYPPRLYSAHFTGQKIISLEEKIALEGNKKTGKPPADAESALSTPQTTSTIIKITSPSTIVDTSSQTPEQLESIQSPGPVTPTSQEPIFPASLNQKKLPPNPFLPYKNPATGRWRGARVSLRRQAELFKIARVYGVEPLLPPSRKSSTFKEERLLQRGLGPRVKGTGEGEKVKGHKWERAMGGLLEKRIKAMEMMPELIREWRMRGNGRGWKKYPK